MEVGVLLFGIFWILLPCLSYFIFYDLRCHLTLCTDEFHQSGDTPPPQVDTVAEVENTATTSDAESVVAVCQSGAEPAESQSAVDLSEDVCPPAVFPQPVLLEDPLILNSPRVTIPKKNNTLKHNCPQSSKVPSVSKKSFLTKQIFNSRKCYSLHCI